MTDPDATNPMVAYLAQLTRLEDLIREGVRQMVQLEAQPSPWIGESMPWGADCHLLPLPKLYPLVRARAEWFFGPDIGIHMVTLLTYAVRCTAPGWKLGLGHQPAKVAGYIARAERQAAARAIALADDWPDVPRTIEAAAERADVYLSPGMRDYTIRVMLGHLFADGGRPIGLVDRLPLGYRGALVQALGSPWSDLREAVWGRLVENLRGTPAFIAQQEEDAASAAAIQAHRAEAAARPRPATAQPEPLPPLPPLEPDPSPAERIVACARAGEPVPDEVLDDFFADLDLENAGYEDLISPDFPTWGDGAREALEADDHPWSALTDDEDRRAELIEGADPTDAELWRVAQAVIDAAAEELVSKAVALLEVETDDASVWLVDVIGDLGLHDTSGPFLTFSDATSALRDAGRRADDPITSHDLRVLRGH